MENDVISSRNEAATKISLQDWIPVLSPFFYPPYPVCPPAVSLQGPWSARTGCAYLHALRHFKDWAYLNAPFPTSPAIVAEYLTNCAQVEGVRLATLQVRVCALRLAHIAMGYTDPTASLAVSMTMKTLRRQAKQCEGGTSNRRSAMSFADLLRMSVAGLDVHEMRDAHDRAFLLVGFLGAFRPGEITAIRIEQLSETAAGLRVAMGATTADQSDARGRYKMLPYGPVDRCPAGAVRTWLAAAQLTSGWLFRGINKAGKLISPRASASSQGPLSAPAGNTILRRRARLAGLDHRRYTMHSLRAGSLAASRNAATGIWPIQEQSDDPKGIAFGIEGQAESIFRNNAVVFLMGSLHYRGNE